jgi:nucleoside-diphosphate-sugar epimerase
MSRWRSKSHPGLLRGRAEVAVALVTGSGGLVGSDSVRYLVEAGWDVVGLENDMRASFFGPDASTNHRWWISDLAEFTADYPEWGLTHDVESILSEIHDANLHRWSAARA